MGTNNDDWLKGGALCAKGALIALSSGAVIGTGIDICYMFVCNLLSIANVCSDVIIGYGLLTESVDDQVDKLMKKICWRGFGGGVFTLGLYLWSPIWIRALWIRSD